MSSPMASLSSVAALLVLVVCSSTSSCLPSAMTDEPCTAAMQQHSNTQTAFMAASVVPKPGAFPFILCKFVQRVGPFATWHGGGAGPHIHVSVMMSVLIDIAAKKWLSSHCIGTIDQGESDTLPQLLVAFMTINWRQSLSVGDMLGLGW